MEAFIVSVSEPWDDINTFHPIAAFTGEGAEKRADDFVEARYADPNNQGCRYIVSNVAQDP